MFHRDERNKKSATNSTRYTRETLSPVMTIYCLYEHIKRDRKLTYLSPERAHPSSYILTTNLVCRWQRFNGSKNDARDWNTRLLSLEHTQTHTFTYLNRVDKLNKKDGGWQNMTLLFYWTNRFKKHGITN